MLEIHKGQIINLTCGEYSDYRVAATLRALRDFSDEDIKREYECPTIEVWIAQGLDPQFYNPHRNPNPKVTSPSLLCLWLTMNGWAEELDAVELWAPEWWPVDRIV